MKRYICFDSVYLKYILIFLFILDLISAKSVKVNITSNDPNDQGLPNDIIVTFTTDTNLPVEFRMIRVDYDSLKIYSIETDQDGHKIKKENVSNNEEVAFYQDIKKGSALQLSRPTGNEGQPDDFIIMRGQYQQGDVTYSIEPTLRSKREASQNDSQSVQRYKIKRVSSPSNTKSDFLVPALEHHYSLPTNMEGHIPFGLKFKRQRRQTLSTYYIDVTAFLDSTCYSRFLTKASNDPLAALTKIREYYAFMFTEIDLIYQNFQSTKFKLRVRLTKVVIFKSASDFQLKYVGSYVDAEGVWNDFRTFLSSSKGRDLVFPYDHAMLFVGGDLMWNSSPRNMGFAWIKTMCSTDGSSSSVVEDMGDYSVLIHAAHELGHSLSAYHDGSNNSCPESDRYLMAPFKTDSTTGTESHPWRFSTCTVNYITSYITDLANTPSGLMCLSNTLEVIGEFPDVSNRLLGQEIPQYKQCQMKFGSSSYVCESVTLSSGNVVHSGCSGLYCHDPSTENLCYLQLPLSGTICDNGKICWLGVCTVDTFSQTTSYSITTTFSTFPVSENSSTSSTMTTTLEITSSSTNATLPFTTTLDITTSIPTTTTLDITPSIPTTTTLDITPSIPTTTTLGITTSIPTTTTLDITKSIPTTSTLDIATSIPTTATHDSTKSIPTTTTLDITRSFSTSATLDITTSFSTTTTLGITTLTPTTTTLDTTKSIPTTTTLDITTSNPTTTTLDITKSIHTTTTLDITRSFSTSATLDFTTSIPTTKTVDITTSIPTTTTLPTSTIPPTITTPVITTRPVNTTTNTSSSLLETSTATICVDQQLFTINGLSCQSAMLQSENLCYNTLVQKSCCDSCKRRATNIIGCEYGNRVSKLCTSDYTCAEHAVDCCLSCRSSGSGGVWPKRKSIYVLNLGLFIIFHLPYLIG